MTSGVSFEPLSPAAFLARAAEVHGERIAIVDGERRITYAQMHARAGRVAAALRDLGAREGDRVAVLAANSTLALECHYAVPWAGAVLVALNFRLNAAELQWILTHSGARLLICDQELVEVGRRALPPGDGIRLLTQGDYEELATDGPELRRTPSDERELLALNYTSGTTGRPKGVMYHHRGAYLQALAMVAAARLTPDTRYLWTLPMFHCNGWCFTWAVTAAGGRHVCLRRPDGGVVWRLLRAEGVSHLCAAPTVLTDVVHHQDAAAPARPVWVGTGGSPPTPTLLRRAAELGLDVTHLYGLTETFGPVVVSEWRSEWDVLSADEQFARKARQGIANAVSQPIRVIGRDGEDVPRDGTTVGEVALRGNNVMLGYFQDPEATAAATPDGWFRTGDLGVLHSDGYLELSDRSKDVIVSGGENISSVEVEAVIASHPAVLEVAVFAIPDDRWGERPAARVTTKVGVTVTAEELKSHVRAHLSGYKVPDVVSFGALPKTATGKIRKYALREEAWRGRQRRIA